MKNSKSKNGITLIALVITIIVLLILAGVTIATLTGENGLLGKAAAAKEASKKADAIEDIKLKIIEVQSEKKGNATLKDLIEYLENIENEEYKVTKVSSGTANLAAGSIQASEIENSQKLYITNTKYGYEIAVNKDLTIDETILTANNNSSNSNNNNNDTSNNNNASTVSYKIYIDNEEVNYIPGKNDGYQFDSIECSDGATATWDNSEWGPNIRNLSSINTICTIHFVAADSILSTWLNYANLNINDYNSIQAVLSNTNACHLLMTSNSAIDYMVTKETLLNSVVGSQTAMTELGKSDYGSSTVLKNQTAFSKIVASSYIQDFTNSRQLIPQMSSNSSTEGTAGFTGTKYYEPYYAFDRSNSTSWGTSTLGTLTFSFDEARYAYMIKLYLKTNAGLGSLASTFKGTIKLYLDGAEVYSSASKTITVNSDLDLNLDNLTKFDKIVFTQDTTISSSSSNWSGLTEMQVYGCQ